MADEAALALRPGGSPSAVSAEKESASPPTGEPLRKRPRRDGPGLGRSPGEPDGTAPEREAPAAAGGGPAAALWREVAAAGGEREAQVAAGGEGDNGPGLQVLTREPPPPADDLDDDDDDEEGEEEEEAAAIGYRGAQRRGRPDCALPRPLPGPPGVRWRGLGRPGVSGLGLRRPSRPRGPRLRASGAAGLDAGAACRLLPALPSFPSSAARLGGLGLCAAARPGSFRSWF